MRVGLVVSGGVDRSGRDRVIPSLLWLIERLARTHELHVFALHYEDAPCSYPLLGATVHDLGTGRVPHGLRRITQRRRLRSTLAALPAMDVLHGYWGIPAGWVAMSAGRSTGIPVIVTADSGEFVADPEIAYGLQRRRLDRRLIAVTMAGAAHVTVCTRHMAGLAARHGVTASVVPIGVPPAFFADAAAPAGPPWRLLQVAHLNPVKDQATLIRAVAALRARHPDVTLDIVGEGALRDDLTTMAGAHGIAPIVTFHGVLPSIDVRSLIARSHVYVQSSRHEAAGVAVLEAAAAGLPIVGTNAGYVADWAPDAATAVEAGDPVALASAIADLLHDPDRRTRMGASAKARSASCTADDTAEAFAALYRDVVAEWRR